MPPTHPTSSVITEQITRALGEAVIRIWSNLPQEVQNHLFQEAVTSQGESIRSQLAVFLHDKHSRTADPLGDPRQATEPDITCFLFRAVGLTAHGTALGPTIRLKPTSLDGEGSEIWSGVLTVPPCAQTSLDEAKSRSTKPVDTAVGREPFAP